MIILLDPLPGEQGWKRPNLSGNRIMYPYKSSPHGDKKKKPSNKCQNSVKNSLVKWNSREIEKSYTNTKWWKYTVTKYYGNLASWLYRTIPGDSQFFTWPGNILLPQSIKEIKKETKLRNHYIICLSGMVFRDM